MEICTAVIHILCCVYSVLCFHSLFWCTMHITQYYTVLFFVDGLTNLVVVSLDFLNENFFFYFVGQTFISITLPHWDIWLHYAWKKIYMYISNVMTDMKILYYVTWIFSIPEQKLNWIWIHMKFHRQFRLSTDEPTIVVMYAFLMECSLILYFNFFFPLFTNGIANANILFFSGRINRWVAAFRWENIRIGEEKKLPAQWH